MTAPSQLLRATHYATGQRIDVTCAGGVITRVGPAGTQTPQHVGDWISPALFDLQVNGCLGVDFASSRLKEEDVGLVAHRLYRHGVGGFLPTLVTSAREALRHAFTTLRKAREQSAELARAIPGFHLEGPYISPEDGARGAHPKAHVRRPDLDEFRELQDAAGGLIRLVTLAPEVPGALPFIERLTRDGVVVAIGHTASSGATIREAVRAGAKLSTHLGNGSHAVLPRHDNYIWEQLAADELWASLITDGHHLPAPVVKSFIRAKGVERVILTCDASSLAGLPPGRYSEWSTELEVRPEGKVVVPGTSFLAGSAAFTDTCVRMALRWAGVSLREAVEMASHHPRALLSLPVPTLEVGQPADLILFQHGPSEEFKVTGTLIGDRWIEGGAC